MIKVEVGFQSFSSQALEFRTPLFPHLVPPAIMVWIFVWKYIFEPFLGPAAVLLKKKPIRSHQINNFMFGEKCLKIGLPSRGNKFINRWEWVTNPREHITNLKEHVTNQREFITKK